MPDLGNETRGDVLHIAAEDGLAVHDTELNQGPSTAKRRLHNGDTLKETSKQRLGRNVERPSAKDLLALRVQALEKGPHERIQIMNIHKSRAASIAPVKSDL